MTEPIKGRCYCGAVRFQFSQAPLAVQATMNNVRRAFLEGADAAIAEFVPVMQKLALTEDAAEGVKSFQEKRPPVYRGR